jgi:thiol-disulfide isomerase/thioredoxin
MDAYEQSYLNLPEGLDNPVPAILEKHAGKVIVLDFWATWCAPCISEMKNGYPQLIHKYSPEEVAFVFLARRSSATNWRDRISKLQFSADHYLTDDQQAAVTSKLFGIGAIPHHTLFDRQGNLVKAEASRSLSGLEREIDALLVER